MRAVVQRVDRSSVMVGGKEISAIGQGVVVFLGVERGDDQNDADYLADKIAHLRIFEDDAGKMNLSLIDVKGSAMVISQFTLLGNCRKGRRPSFVDAADPEPAKMLYDYFVSRVSGVVNRVATGEFQSMMTIEAINDGPVTLLLDSRRLF